MFVILFAVVGGIYIKYDMTMKANKRLKTEITEIKAASLAKDGTIASQARQGERKANSQAELNDAESKINAVPDSQLCANSEPIKVALDQLRAKQVAD